MSTSLAQTPVAFHISLNVSDLTRSVEFFRGVFGTEPAKHREDYAKFELENPPITLSLEPVSPAERGTLNHVGFKFKSAEELVELQRRLELAGLHSEREEGVECCYAKQSKFWLHDPEGTLWEMYVLEGDLDHRGAGQEAQAVMGQADAKSNGSSQPAIACSMQTLAEETKQWSHRLGNPLAIPAEVDDGTLDEIALQGTFNAEGTLAEMETFLSKVHDKLKAGGRVLLHCLTADRPLAEVPPLPGPASVVKSVPCLETLIDHLEAAGFEGIRLTTYRSRPCFTAGEVEMRETKIEARKPKVAGSQDDRVTVVYKGPLRELSLDSGETLHRGRPAELPRAAAEQLGSVALGESLVIIERATSPVSCTG